MESHLLTERLLQHGFDNFLSRLEIADFEPEHARGRLTRDARNKVPLLGLSIIMTSNTLGFICCAAQPG